MNKAGKKILYLLLIIVVAVFFMYFLFPEDTVKKFMISKVSDAYPDFSITMDRIKPAFPPGLKFQNVNIYHLKESFLNAKQINITPGLFSIFQSKKVIFFKIKAYEGVIKGRAYIKKNKKEEAGKPNRNVIIDANLAGIRIKDIPALINLTDHKITGTLNGKVSYSITGHNDTAGAKIDMSNVTIKLSSPIFNLDSFTLRDIKADLAISNQRLQIDKCIIKGDQVDGSISGFIHLKGHIKKSVLNLTAIIKPHTSFLAHLGKNFPVTLLLKKGLDEKGFSLKINGTFEQPGFSF